MDSLKIDFYFEVFEQLKSFVLSYLTKSTETNSYFDSFTYEKKTYLAVISSH